MLLIARERGVKLLLARACLSCPRATPGQESQTGVNLDFGPQRPGATAADCRLLSARTRPRHAVIRQHFTDSE